MKNLLHSGLVAATLTAAAASSATNLSIQEERLAQTETAQQTRRWRDRMEENDRHAYRDQRLAKRQREKRRGTTGGDSADFL